MTRETVGDILEQLDKEPEAMTVTQLIAPPATAVNPYDPPQIMTPMLMIDRAISSGSNVETLEKLMAMQERYEAVQARREFDEAISAAKSEIGPIFKNKKVDFTTQKGRTNYSYEDLAEVSRTVDPVLARHGLSYRYRTSQEGGRLTVTCIMSHKRGHREETSLQASNDESGNKNSIQAVGSAATYLQRYTLKLSLGLSATTDTDGHIPDDQSTSIDAERYQALTAMIEKTNSDENKLLQFLKADSLENLTVKQYEVAMSAMQKKVRT
jgi:hypothetical protein